MSNYAIPLIPASAVAARGAAAQRARAGWHAGPCNRRGFSLEQWNCSHSRPFSQGKDWLPATSSTTPILCSNLPLLFFFFTWRFLKT